MKFYVDDKNRCRLVCVKFHLNRCRFAAAVAKCLGGSLFFGTQCINKSIYLSIYFSAAASDAASAHLTCQTSISCWRTQVMWCGLFNILSNSWSSDQLFERILNNPHHTLYQLLPPQSAASQNYNLRSRIHDRQLHEHQGHPSDCNFITRLMYKNSYWQ